MALFEKGYKAAAIAELERSVRDLEERDKTAQTKPAFEKDAADTQSNLNFAERLNLINAVQAEAFRQRIQKAQIDFEHMQRTETRDDIVDSFENPRERAARYQDMDKYNAQIAAERANISAVRSADNESFLRNVEPTERER